MQQAYGALGEAASVPLLFRPDWLVEGVCGDNPATRYIQHRPEIPVTPGLLRCLLTVCAARRQARGWRSVRWLPEEVPRAWHAAATRAGISRRSRGALLGGRRREKEMMPTKETYRQKAAGGSTESEGFRACCVASSRWQAKLLGALRPRPPSLPPLSLPRRVQSGKFEDAREGWGDRKTRTSIAVTRVPLPLTIPWARDMFQAAAD